MAKGDNLNIKLGVDIANLKKGFADAIQVVKDSGKSTEAEAKKMVETVAKQFDKIGGQTTMRGMIRQMENLTGQMQQMGMTGTKAFRDAAMQTAKLRAEQDDLKGIIDAYRPDAPFNAMAGAIKTSAQAMAGLQGAMALFGSESEDVQKILLKVNAAMALAEGTKAIDGFADAFKQLNLVMRANPALAIASGVAALMAIMVAFNKETQRTPTIYEQLNAARDQATESVGKEIGKVNALLMIARDENESKENRRKAIEEINKISPEYLGHLTAENISTIEATKAVDKYTESLFKQAMAKAALNKLEEKGAELMQLEVAAATARQKTEDQLRKMGPMSPGEAKIFRDQTESLLTLTKSRIAQVKREMQEIVTTSRDIGLNLFSATETPKPTAPTAGTGGKSTAPTPSFVNVGKVTLPMKQLSASFQLATKSTAEMNDQLTNKLPKSISVAGNALSSFNGYTEQIWQNWERMVENMRQATQQFIVDGIGALAESIGSAIASGDMRGLFDSVLQQFAGFLQQFGKLLVSWGVARLALFESFTAGPAGAAKAIAAGAALIAIGAAMKTAMNGQSQTMGGGNGQFKSPGFTPFADGGIVSGPTMGLVGEYPGASNNPEVIAPLSDLTKLLGSGGGPMKVEHRISGNDLLVIIDRATKFKSRNGG